MAEPARQNENQPPVDIAEFRQLLIERRDQILKDAGMHRQQIDQQKSTGGYPVEVEEMSVVDLNSDFYLSLSNRDRDRMIEIRDAFDRIQTGTYGYCERCGEPIRPERLRALPEARYDVECQEAVEARERVRRPSPTPGL